MKFSDLLGEPEPEETPAAAPAERQGAPVEADPITVFSPVPETDRVPPVRDADATIPVPSVPPPVNPPFDPVNPPFDPVNPPLDPVVDPVLDAPPPAPVIDAPALDPVLDVPPPAPTLTVAGAGRSDLASLNVHQPAPAPEPTRSSVLDQLAGLDEVVDDLLPPRRSRK